MKFKEKIFQLNIKKEQAMLVQVVSFFLPIVISGLLFFFYRSERLLIIAAFGPLLVLMYRQQIATRFQKLQIEHEEQFISGMNYLRVYLSNGINVYSSLSALRTYLKPWFKAKVDELLTNIDVDKSITPYLRMAAYFKNPLVEEILIAIYQLNESGNQVSELWQFNHLFLNYQNALQTNKTMKTRNYFSRMALLPLLASGLVIIGISIGIMGVIGDLINGL